MWGKDRICIDEQFVNKFGNEGGYFEKGDFAGIGIICKANSSLECFATWNGKLLGKIIFEKYLKKL